MLPYITEDLWLAEKLVGSGCEVLMPWGARIGSGQGFANPLALTTMLAYFPNIPLVIDAGIWGCAHATSGLGRRVSYCRRHWLDGRT